MFSSVMVRMRIRYPFGVQVDADVVDASGVVGGDLVHFALGHAAVSGYRDRDLVCVNGARCQFRWF